MNRMILTCEDTAEGILTAVYQAYAWKLQPESTEIQAGEADLCLFASYRRVETDAALAEKVAATVIRRFGEEAWEDISYALAAHDAGRGQAVYQAVAAGLSGRIRGPLMQGLTDGAVRKVFELSRHMHREAQRMIQFLRFRELEGGVLFARIEPCENVTALVAPHFADRFPLENFVIADTGHRIAAVHPAGKAWFLVWPDGETAERFERMSERYSAAEKEMAELFRRFCVSTGIRDRKNRKLQQQLLPLRYRGTMTEFDRQEVL